ncbi:MAG: hypothetical protein ABL901_03925 [Hyphomicrobiaceae bacterium]
MPVSSDVTSHTTRRPTGEDPGSGWGEPAKPPRDWKKLALVGGLGLLSWVATYVGMLELIEANMGELPLVHKLIIGFSVAMLMTMVVWLLDEMFKPNPFVTKMFYAFGYLFLTIISVGFGFGFYWKVLESRSEASRSAEGAVSQVQGSLVAASTRLDQLQATLDQLTAVSTQKAQTEKASGTSCPNSKPGDGPRRKMREDDAARFSFAADFVKGRATAVKAEMGALDVDLARIVTDDKSTVDAKTGTRNAFMQSLGRKLDNTVTGFNAFRTDPQLKQIKTDLAERAEKASFPDSQGKSYSCPDPQLQTALRGVVRAIEQLPELEKPKIAAVEGSEATIEAFRRLTASFYGLLSFKMPPSADELRDLQKKAVQSVETPSATAKHSMNEQPGLSKRDYVPLAIAVFVDLCLLLVSMGGKSHDRLSGLVPKMRAAEQGPVIQILSRFNEIHRDRQIRENFELFRHVVFDFHGDYYVAVPLDAPRKMNPREREDLRLETQLLSNLFASFEKEKIFSRVYSPFLTSGAIRKRLARQGSKFERSDAFRVYRFKDGAWSDIILGAVMGAAKRVEAEKRLISARADQTARVAAAAVAVAQAAAANEPTYPAFGHGEPVGSGRTGAWTPPWPTKRGTARTATQPSQGGEQSRVETGFEQQFGSYAPYAAAETTRTGGATGFGSSANFGGNVHPLPQRMNEPQMQPVYQPLPPFQPYFDRNADAANSNTAPVRAQVNEDVLPVADVLPFTPPNLARPGPAYNPRSQAVAAEWEHAAPVHVTPTPGLPMAPVQSFVPPAPEMTATAPKYEEPVNFTTPDWQQQMGVVMTRVTESITVPVSSQAELPQALMAAGFMARRAAHAGAASVEAEPVVLIAHHAVEGAAAEGDDWSVADTALIKKYASQPGE